MFTLDDPGCIPEAIQRILRANHDIIREVRYFDHLMEISALRAAAEQLDAVVRAAHVRAYHCTKEIHPGTVASTGLRTLSIERHLSEVLTLVRRVAPELGDDMRTALERRRVESDIKYREGPIWFCLTRSLVCDGTERFFTYYGGEVVYGAFSDEDRCLSVLASLGRPVVVEVMLPASQLRLTAIFPFARPLIGRYAQAINPAFQREDLEGYLLRSVSPAEILRVHEQSAFFTSA